MKATGSMFCSILAGALSITISAFSQQVQHTRCEYKTDPAGIEARHPRLSWQLAAEERNILQSAYEVRVGTDAMALRKGKDVLWQTGKVNSDQSVHVPYAGPALRSGQKYYWQVRVWDNRSKATPWSDVSSWEMGLLEEADWKAQWIRANMDTDGKITPAPMFRKGFELAGTVRSARLYITSHGLYEASLNGVRVGDHYFTPGWTSYDKRLQYQVYDVTHLLKPGRNAAGVMLGDGWFRGNLVFFHQRNTYGKEAALLYQLDITYTNGKKEMIVSDGSWKVSFDGPVRSSDIYNGETYDARMEIPGWNTAGYDDARWGPARTADIPKSNLVAPDGPPVRKHEHFKPVRFIRTPKGEMVMDFGQNLVGWVQLKLKGTPGDTITLHHAEVLDQTGNFYTANLRSAKQENKFIFKGGKDEVFEPHFTFQGFRYVRISGYKEKLDTGNITAVAVYSDMTPAGTFTCSHPLVNQLQHNIQWGQKGNFLDVPTDCPQRDERLGWTGDAQVFFNTAAFNMQVAGFFTKWLKDLKADQRPDGDVPVVIPDVRSIKTPGSAGWGDVATIIPWNFYLAYGDKQVLETQYASMKAWVDHITKVSENNLWNNGFHYGDWLFYSVGVDNDGRSAITDKYLIAQAFYIYSTRNLVHAAEVLGKQEDATQYGALLEKLKAAFMREYATPSGRLVSSSQTAYVLALQFDILPEELRQQAVDRLVRNIESYGNHLTTGFLGTPYLCHVLSRFGRTDVAYKLLLQETYPSWLYPVKKGATTIWERWDGIKPDGSFQDVGMNSFNHYAYGAIGDWMYKVVAGIDRNHASPGYKQIRIAPQPGGNLTSAAATLESPYGRIASAWKIENGRMRMDVIIPPNTAAVVVFPQAAGATVTEGGKEVRTEKAGSDATLNIGSGSYHFEFARDK